MNRSWNILNWNVRGINSTTRWNDIRKKIDESACCIMTFQETKRDNFDIAYIKNFCPMRFNQFCFSPSNGNSGGLITIWNGNLMKGKVLSQNYYQITIEFTSNLDSTCWYLTNVYGPNSTEGKQEFTDWLMGLNMSQSKLWMILGDFNYIRSPDNRNKPGGDPASMMTFNNIIVNLDLAEIPLKGRAFTWTNKQDQPLLEKLDWIFTSPHWTTIHPSTMATPLAKISSNHVPIKIQIDSNIPRSQIFRFEEYWTEFSGFIETVEKHWLNSTHFSDSPKNLNSKFKSIKRGLKSWSKQYSQLNKIIDNCCFYVKLFDGIEEQRPLARVEKNFRKLLIKHTNKLLEAKRIYWRIRANMRWANLCDENTEFFHAIATYVFRHNYITYLMTMDGQQVFDHDHKAAILWASFKDRIGTETICTQNFDISHLAMEEDLYDLDRPFSTDEIDDIINKMPNEKSPGPDGFNGLFMKKCWHIIKHYFYKFINDFYNEAVSLAPVNTAYITLIPKNDNPEIPDDYRPISLVSMPIKILTKLLANRVQQIIISRISKNQYGFIKTRNIQDCLAWSFEYIHMCHKSKKEIIIFKIDFVKAFDKVSYKAILYMMQHLGFTKKWIRWVSSILSTASTSVILNSVPGKCIQCKCGVRQGDPFSPLLYVMVGELLQIMVNDAWRNGTLSLPIETNFTESYPIIQYADDTLVILPADEVQIRSFIEILDNFSKFTGLVVNYSKSSMVPINMSDDKAQELANSFNCKKESMPFTYLGLPMGSTRPKVADLMPMVSRLDHKLSGIASLMSYSGRLVHLKSIVAALPIFAMCCIRVPFTILDHFEKSGRNFLWYGKDINKKGNCLVKWDNVCLQNREGAWVC